MELRTLRYFLAVCEHGTMSRAAEALHLTQPALSRQVASLERELGCALLERHSRSVTPTSEGLYLMRRAREIVGLADRTAEDLSRDGAIVEGDVRVGAGESEAMRGFARHMAAFRDLHPGVRFHVHSGNAPDLAERLGRGVDDFAVIMGPPDTARHASLRLPAADVWGAVVREDDPLAGREAVAAEDLAQVPLIVPERHASAGGVTGELASWFGAAELVPPIAATVNLAFNGAMLVRAGAGRMLAYGGLVATGRGTGLAFLPLAPRLVSEAHLAWKRDEPLGEAARRFLAFVRERLAGEADDGR